MTNSIEEKIKEAIVLLQQSLKQKDAKKAFTMLLSAQQHLHEAIVEANIVHNT